MSFERSRKENDWVTAFPKSHRIDRYEEGCPYEKFARKPFNTFSSLTTHKPQHTHTLIDVHAAIACAVFYSEITQRETGKHCFLPTSRYWEPPPPTVYVLSLPRARSMTHQRAEGFPRLWSNTERNPMHRQSDYYEFIISIFLSI